MMPALSATKALGLIAIFAIFAIAVSAGCSSPSPQSSPTTGKHLKGSMDEWVNAVCTKRGPLPMKRGACWATARPIRRCASSSQTATLRPRADESAEGPHGRGHGAVAGPDQADAAGCPGTQRYLYDPRRWGGLRGGQHGHAETGGDQAP